MATVREEALDALYTVLSAAIATATREVYRNKEEALDIPADGILVLRDGSSGEPDVVLLSPQRFIYDHLAELTVVVKDSTDATRDSKLDAIFALIDSSIAADRTLGGKVEWCESNSPDVFNEEEDGQLFKYAIVPILMRFTTTNALS